MVACDSVIFLSVFPDRTDSGLGVTHLPSLLPCRCVLGNTTILAEFAGEEEVNRFLAQGQALPPTSSWQSSSGGSQPRLGTSGSTHGLVRSDTAHWNTPCLSGKGSSELLWGGVPQYSSSLWGPPSADDARVIGSPTPLNTLLPGDLLSGESI